MRADGTSRFWNVAFKRPSKESSLPYFMMQLRPELVGAIERVFPRWRKNNADFRMEVLNRKIKQSSWEPLRDEEIVFESLDVKIAPEKAANQEVSDSAAPQRVDCYKRAVSEICNSEDGRKVEERVFQWEYDKLEGKAPEGVLKRMKEFFEHRQDRYGYDVLSYDLETGRDKYIEVKSTRTRGDAMFELTANEVNFAKKHLDDYCVYRVVAGKGLMIISGKELFEDYYVRPEKYRVYGYPDMDEEKALELVNKLEWHFAKTYATSAPHEYAVVKVGDKYRGEVVALMKYIFKNGVVEYFYDKPFTVYYLGDRKYWSMAKDEKHITEETFILNRTVEETTNKLYRR